MYVLKKRKKKIQLQDTAFAVCKFEKVFANPGACSCICRTGSKSVNAVQLMKQ